MKRIIKNPDIRRGEIISAAEKLFETKGYANTSVEEIIKEAGIAKGTFYYYFKAKKDILRALVEQIGSERAEYFSSIVEKNDLTALDKLQQILRDPQEKAKNISTVMTIIHKPENRELQEQLNIHSVKIIAPLISKVLEQGNREGAFNKTTSAESIQLILAGSQFVLDSGLFEWPEERRVAFLNSIELLLEQIVGAKSGSFNFISKDK